MKRIGLIVLLVFVAAVTIFTTTSASCKGRVLFGPRLPQEAGTYFLVTGGWRPAPDEISLSQSYWPKGRYTYGPNKEGIPPVVLGLIAQAVSPWYSMSIAEFEASDFEVRNSAILKWYIKFTSSELASARMGLGLSALPAKVGGMATYTLSSLHEFTAEDGSTQLSPWREGSTESNDIEMTTNELNLNKGYFLCAFNPAGLTPGRYALIRWGFGLPAVCGCFTVL